MGRGPFCVIISSHNSFLCPPAYHPAGIFFCALATGVLLTGKASTWVAGHLKGFAPPRCGRRRRDYSRKGRTGYRLGCCRQSVTLFERVLDPVADLRGVPERSASDLHGPWKSLLADQHIYLAAGYANARDNLSQGKQPRDVVRHMGGRQGLDVVRGAVSWTGALRSFRSHKG